MAKKRCYYCGNYLWIGNLQKACSTACQKLRKRQQRALSKNNPAGVS